MLVDTSLGVVSTRVPRRRSTERGWGRRSRSSWAGIGGNLRHQAMGSFSRRRSRSISARRSPVVLTLLGERGDHLLVGRLTEVGIELTDREERLGDQQREELV